MVLHESQYSHRKLFVVLGIIVIVVLGIVYFSDGLGGLATRGEAGLVSDAGPDQTVNVGDTVLLNGSNSKPAKRIVSYAWTILKPSQSTITLSGAIVNFVADQAGNYTTTLTVKDKRGKTASDSAVINAVALPPPPPPPNQPPVASFTANPQSGNAPLAVSFNASASSDSDGTIVNYSWNFGDGASGTGVTTSHTYQNAGTFTATLTVADDDSATSKSSKVINVTNATPPQDTTSPNVSVGHSPLNPTTGQTVTITATASDNSGIKNVSVFVDDFLVRSCSVSPCSHSTAYSTAGTHTYYATATDTSGNIGRDPATGSKSFSVSQLHSNISNSTNTTNTSV